MYNASHLEGGAQVETHAGQDSLKLKIEGWRTGPPPMSVLTNVVGATGSSADTPFRGNMVSQALRRADDNVLIREAQRGNRAAFEELVRQYDQAVLRLALRLTASEQDAQDIYQEAFLKAYRNLV